MLMLGAPLLWSDEVTGFTCWAVAFIVNAGRLAAATMPVLPTRNLRRDVAPQTILFGSFMMIFRRLGSHFQKATVASHQIRCSSGDSLRETLSATPMSE